MIRLASDPNSRSARERAQARGDGAEPLVRSRQARAWPFLSQPMPAAAASQRAGGGGAEPPRGHRSN